MLDPGVRYPCPVCLGVKMSRVRLVAKSDLVLDRCERCGGIWFDEGEVARLRELRFEGARQKIRPADSAFHMSCHHCRALMDRNAEKCPACSWENLLDCPLCSRPMKRREREGLHLDFCTSCRGVWFDQIELAEIWNLHAESIDRRRAFAGNVVEGVGEAGADLAGILFWSSELIPWNGEALAGGAHAVASGVANLAAEAPRAIGGALEGTGDLAGTVFEADTVFEAIADIVGSIFN